MKFRWIILSFILGLIGAFVIGCVGSSLDQSTEGDIKSIGNKVGSMSKSQKELNEVLNKLPKGVVYHNVPQEMQVGNTVTIKAGIAPKMTEKIQAGLKSKGSKLNISEVRYDNLGTKMDLIVDESAFKKLVIQDGAQFISDQTPGLWIWDVKPLKSGNQKITINATINLKVSTITHPQPVQLFEDTRNVKVNFIYSTREFIFTNWKEVIALVFGSGSLAGFFTWWTARKNKEKP